MITLFAESFDWPGWLGELSPIGWVPTLPLDEWTTTPLLVLLAVAAVLHGAGFTGFRRRDVVPG